MYRLIHDDKRQECITDNPNTSHVQDALKKLVLLLFKALTKEQLDKILEEEKK